MNKKNTEIVTNAIIKWIGSVKSLVLHTFLFVLNFSLHWFGVSTNTIMLILTTAVSIEAIYLAILMQMSLNIQSDKLDKMEESENKQHDTDNDNEICDHCGSVIEDDEDE